MKKFLVALIIILAVLALAFFVWYNFFHKAPHEHYSEDAETIVEACPDCVTDGAEYKLCRECGDDRAGNAFVYAFCGKPQLHFIYDPFHFSFTFS